MSIIIIGGGAAGFFAALAAKKASSSTKIILLEKSSQLLSKVRISGGGRCNVTHACFDPKELVKNYPRGQRELLGPFTRFQPADTIRWFESRGVTLKTESDGRMFPVTDDSNTIISCLMAEAKKLGVQIETKSAIEAVEFTEGGFNISLQEGQKLQARSLLIATGSHPSGYKIAKQFGHTIEEALPSLFTFNTPSSPLKELAGVTVPLATLSLSESSYTQTGPLLITHWGFSGPAALKLSAWAAPHLKKAEYKAKLLIDWIPNTSREALQDNFKKIREKHPSQLISNNGPPSLPKSLWKKFIEISGLIDKRMSELSNDTFIKLVEKLKNDFYQIEGKTTHKEEFVTCGGVVLNEINFKTMESRVQPGLFFAGEVLNIDAVTGGFNFQNAWTTGWIAGNSMPNR